MTSDVERFFAGQRLGATRLNEAVEQINLNARVGLALAEEAVRRETALLEIKALDFANSQITCVRPGEGANAQATEYTVDLPQIYTETARGAVTYVYSDLNTRVASGAAGPDETQSLTPALTVAERVTVRTKTGGGYIMVGDGRMWAVDPP